MQKPPFHPRKDDRENGFNGILIKGLELNSEQTKKIP